jgi:hypothetical protein
MRYLPLLVAISLAGACSAPDPKSRFALDEVESWWAVGSPQGATQFISPVVRFRLKNLTAEPSRSVQAQAIFRRVGEDASWGSDWKQVAPSGAPIPAGGTVPVELRSDGRYNTTGNPESIFQHEEFREVRAEIFLREGGSPWRNSQWTKVAEVLVERRIGPKSAGDPALLPAPASPTP